MTLAVGITKTIGRFDLSVSFESAGRVTALFGRSGAGKTTLVNAIAGLVTPDTGRIAIDGTVLFDAAQRVNVPAHRRGVGYVFQEGRLFPHLSVRANLTYGQRFSGGRTPSATFDEIVALLRIAPLLGRRPADLSGGEKQRVAIGRALLAAPRLLLMDEPLAALDQGHRAEILPYIEMLRDRMRLPIVYVTHTVEEVARLADTVVLIAHGRSIATGSVNEVFGRFDLRPYTGRLDVSMVLNATVAGHDGETGATLLDHPAGRIVASMPGAVGAPVRLRVRAQDVAIAVGEPGNLSIRNRLRGTVVEIGAPEGQAVEVKLDVGGEPLIARITRGAVSALGLKTGQPVVALVKATAFDRLDDV